MINIKNELMNDLKNKDFDKLNVLLGYKTVEETDIDEVYEKLISGKEDNEVKNLLELYKEAINMN